jgi:hypothetical protein
MIGRRREKVFGPGRSVPLDRNQKARIVAYAKAWDRQHRQPGQRGGALGRAALDVLSALLWAFHNARSGCCFPSYERIAEKAGCARSTVAGAIKALEWAGVLTWQNRIVRVRKRLGFNATRGLPGHHQRCGSDEHQSRHNGVCRPGENEQPPGQCRYQTCIRASSPPN